MKKNLFSAILLCSVISHGFAHNAVKFEAKEASLHKNNRYQHNILEENKLGSQKLTGLKYPEIAKSLDSMLVNEQVLQNKHNALMNAGSKNESESLKELVKNWRTSDSLNIQKIKSIFNQYGFMGYEEVGEKGSQSFFQLLQHCDKDPKFQEDVLVEMKKHIERNNANATNFAFLTDRVSINTNKPQIYGTQVKVNKENTSFEAINLFEPNSVNKRRESVGLNTLEEYIGSLNNNFSASLKK
ncbi:MAG: DUF6624 domain-containing protein [Bacteroidota bacterium]